MSSNLSTRFQRPTELIVPSQSARPSYSARWRPDGGESVRPRWVQSKLGEYHGELPAEELRFRGRVHHYAPDNKYGFIETSADQPPIPGYTLYFFCWVDWEEKFEPVPDMPVEFGLYWSHTKADHVCCSHVRCTDMQIAETLTNLTLSSDPTNNSNEPGGQDTYVPPHKRSTGNGLATSQADRCPGGVVPGESYLSRATPSTRAAKPLASSPDLPAMPALQHVFLAGAKLDSHTAAGTPCKFIQFSDSGAFKVGGVLIDEISLHLDRAANESLTMCGGVEPDGTVRGTSLDHGEQSVVRNGINQMWTKKAKASSLTIDIRFVPVFVHVTDDVNPPPPHLHVPIITIKRTSAAGPSPLATAATVSADQQQRTYQTSRLPIFSSESIESMTPS